MADPKKPGVDNLAKAIDLAAKDGAGWSTLGGYGNEPTAAELPDHKGVFCAPADPAIDPKAFEALGEATQTDPSEWGYPLKDGVEVHAEAQPNSPVVEKLGLNLVHVLPDTAPPSGPNPPAFLHVATPSGKSGFVAMDAIAPLGSDQMCYTKDFKRLENCRLSRRREPVSKFIAPRETYKGTTRGTIILPPNIA